MLTFEAPFYEINKVMIFRDHAVATTFYYLAGPPHITLGLDKQPEMMLLKYRNALDAGGAPPATRDDLGGAFLTLGVDCSLSDSAYGDVKEQLESQVGTDVQLVPVLYTKGSVKLIALDYQTGATDGATKSKFVLGVVGSSTPSLDTQSAIFSLALDTDAATLIEDAYQNDLAPIGVMYELEFAGLRPAISVKATVDQKRCYESFQMNIHFGVHTGGGSTTTPTTTTPTTTTTTPPATTPPATTPPATTPPATTPPATTPPATTPPATTPPATTPPATTPPATTPRTTTTTPPADSSTTGGGGGGGVGLDVDISDTIEKLKQEGAITIEIVREQDGAAVDEMQKEAMDMIKEDIIKDFFQPAMSSSPAATAQQLASATTNNGMATTAATNKGSSGSGTRVDIGFSLQMKKQEELKTVTYDYSVSAPETRTHAPNGFISSLVAGLDKAKHIRDINLDDDFFRTLVVQASTIANFPSLNLAKVVVDFSYGGTVEQPRAILSPSFSVDDQAPKTFQAAIEHNQVQYRARKAYYFGQDELFAGQQSEYHGDWGNDLTRSLVINPPADVPMLHVWVEQGVIDWDLVARIETRVSYDDPANHFHAERTFLIGADFKRQQWVVRLTNPAISTYKVQHIWFLKENNRQIHGEEQVMAASQLFVPDPFVDRLPILLQPEVDAANVPRITVEFHYVDADNQLDLRKIVELMPPYKTTTLMLPIMDREKRGYSYKTTLIKANSGAENRAEIATEQLSLIITENGIYFDVNVVLLGDMGPTRMTGLQVDLRAEPLDNQPEKIETHLFETTGDKKYTQRLLLRADRPKRTFDYRTTVYLRDADPIVSDWTAHDSAILVLQVTRLLPS